MQEAVAFHGHHLIAHRGGKNTIKLKKKKTEKKKKRENRFHRYPEDKPQNPNVIFAVTLQMFAIYFV